MGMPIAVHPPPGEADVSRRCVRCERVLLVTPEDELVCPSCGRVRAWTVTVNRRVVAAGRSSMRGGISIWLAGTLDDLRPGSCREPARSCSGWNEES